MNRSIVYSEFWKLNLNFINRVECSILKHCIIYEYTLTILVYAFRLFKHNVKYLELYIFIFKLDDYFPSKIYVILFRVALTRTELNLLVMFRQCKISLQCLSYIHVLLQFKQECDLTTKFKSFIRLHILHICCQILYLLVFRSSDGT